MTDLKKISDEIAAAIFDRIERDRTLILSNVSDVIHKELAVRMPERKPQETRENIISAAFEKLRDGKMFISSNPWWGSDDSWVRDAYLKRRDGKTFKELYECNWDDLAGPEDCEGSK